MSILDRFAKSKPAPEGTNAPGDETTVVRGGSIAFKGGSYSLVLSVVVLAIVVVVNILVNALPAAWTQLDMSASRLYSVTATTRSALSALEDDVTIYWIVQADEEDEVIEQLLAKYDNLSSHVTIVKKNPDTYPTFAEQYTDEQVQNNSLVVECGDKSRYIAYDSIYVTDVDYTTYSSTYSFDGEGAVTSAISYVTSEDFPKVYVTEGHGEMDLSSSFTKLVEKSNMEVESLTLLSEEAVPDDADCVIVNAPESDISKEERDMLADYVAAGGKLMVIAGATEDGALENLYSLLEDYGIEAADGIVIEGAQESYAFRMPYVLLPSMASDDVTQSLINDGYSVVVPLAIGLNMDDADGEVVTELLSTSDKSFSKVAGYKMETYEKEDGDIDGPFAVGVSIQDGDGTIFWVSSSYFLEETYDSYSSGANSELAMNVLSSMIGEGETTSIPAKSMSAGKLSISESQGAMLTLFLVGVIPLACVGAGIYTLLDRRRRRNG